MDKIEVRWVQRFSNFEKAYLRFKESLDHPHPNELERNGIVQRFEFTLETGWKTLKDYLQAEGFEFPLTPKGTLRQAQQAGLITSAQQLIDALEVRNELAHDYDGEKFEKDEVIIRNEIYPALTDLYNFFVNRLLKRTTQIS
ncbi:MAG: HI0074 family nucleotidyltransferase substrate-binding subunit [Cyclobacteriaceae bacterium]|nr:HI0074 family nucleotidyltransferase substrate-binding subunit [Cyclobacteriaceae bacterium]